jgi:hypothetical protein
MIRAFVRLRHGMLECVCDVMLAFESMNSGRKHVPIRFSQAAFYEFRFEYLGQMFSRDSYQMKLE